MTVLFFCVECEDRAQDAPEGHAAVRMPGSQNVIVLCGDKCFGEKSDLEARPGSSCLLWNTRGRGAYLGCGARISAPSLPGQGNWNPFLHLLLKPWFLSL